VFKLSERVSNLNINDEILLRRSRFTRGVATGYALAALVLLIDLGFIVLRQTDAGSRFLLQGDQILIRWSVLRELAWVAIGLLFAALARPCRSGQGDYLCRSIIVVFGFLAALNIVTDASISGFLPGVLGAALICSQFRMTMRAEIPVLFAAFSYFGALAALASLFLDGALASEPRALAGLSIEGAVLTLLLAVSMIMILMERSSARFFVYEGPAGVASRLLVPLAMGVPFISVAIGIAGIRANAFSHSGAILLMTVVPSMILSVTVWWIGGVIHISDLRQRKAKGKILRQYQHLENEVVRRTEDLSIVNRELKQAMEMASSRELFLRRVFDTMDTFIGVLSPDGTVMEINRAALEVSGLTLGDVQGRKFWETPWWNFTTADRDQMADLVCRVAGGETIKQEIRYRAANGRLSTSQFVMAPLLDAEGNVELIVPSGVDIQTRKDFEDQIIKARIEADIANKAKSAFLAHMSHELRSPLGIILGFLDLVRDEADVSEQKRQIEVIERNARQLLALVDEVLDLGKIESGRVSIDIHDVRLDKVIEELASALDVKAQEKGIGLQFEVAPGSPVMLRTDPLRLKQILLNIVGNAVKYTSRGKVGCRIRTRPAPGNNGKRLVEFEVTDSGMGISLDDQSRLFMPFSRGQDAQMQKIPGTGLGLLLARRLANLLGGDVVLEKSEPGKGSTFLVTIAEHTQVDSSLLAPADLTSRRTVNHVRGGKLSGMKVLVVDDVVENRILISRFLEAAGAIVTTASSGNEAMIIANSHSFDVVLMDLSMPGVSGQVATHQLRNEGYLVPIVALTAHALREEKDQALAHGFNDYLTKPVSREDLVDAVARFHTAAKASA
jgi:PAS domain S-box-containing protein